MARVFFLIFICLASMGRDFQTGNEYFIGKYDLIDANLAFGKGRLSVIEGEVRFTPASSGREIIRITKFDLTTEEIEVNIINNEYVNGKRSSSDRHTLSLHYSNEWSKGDAKGLNLNGTIEPLSQIKTNYIATVKQDLYGNTVKEFELGDFSFYGWRYTQGTCNLPTPGGSLNLSCESSHQISGPINKKNYTFFIQEDDQTKKKIGATLPVIQLKDTRIESSIAASESKIASSHQFSFGKRSRYQLGVAHNTESASYRLSTSQPIHESQKYKSGANLSYKYSPMPLTIDDREITEESQYDASIGSFFQKKRSWSFNSSLSTRLKGDSRTTLSFTKLNGRSSYQLEHNNYKQDQVNRNKYSLSFSRNANNWTNTLSLNRVTSNEEDSEQSLALQSKYNLTDKTKLSSLLELTQRNDIISNRVKINLSSKYRQFNYSMNFTHTTSGQSINTSVGYNRLRFNHSSNITRNRQSEHKSSLSYSIPLTTKADFLRMPLNYFNDISIHAYIDKNLNGEFDKEEISLSNYSFTLQSQLESQPQVLKFNEKGHYSQRFLESGDFYNVTIDNDEFLQVKDSHSLKVNEHLSIPLYLKETSKISIQRNGDISEVSVEVFCKKSGYRESFKSTDNVNVQTVKDDNCVASLKKSQDYIFYQQSVEIKNKRATLAVHEASSGRTGVIQSKDNLDGVDIYSLSSGEYIDTIDGKYFYFETSPSDIEVEGYKCKHKVNHLNFEEIIYFCTKK